MKSASLVLSAVIFTRMQITGFHHFTAGETKAQKDYNPAPVTLLVSGRTGFRVGSIGPQPGFLTRTPLTRK